MWIKSKDWDKLNNRLDQLVDLVNMNKVSESSLVRQLNDARDHNQTLIEKLMSKNFQEYSTFKDQDVKPQKSPDEDFDSELDLIGTVQD